MLTFSLQSGSNGNAIYIEAHGVSLLFDAGISGRQAQQRLLAFGRDMGRVDALVISHEHWDHIRYAGAYQRQFGLPIFVTPGTWSRRAPAVGPVKRVRFFRPGDVLDFGSLRVHTVATPHDATESVAFVVEGSSGSVGIFTDLGHPFPDLVRWLDRVDAAYLESNFDEQMLAAGPYRQELKLRIRGPSGHLSNEESARLVATRRGSPLQWLALAHLSEQNNSPEVALATHRNTCGDAVPLAVATRYGPSQMFQL